MPRVICYCGVVAAGKGVMIVQESVHFIRPPSQSPSDEIPFDGIEAATPPWGASHACRPNVRRYPGAVQCTKS